VLNKERVRGGDGSPEGGLGNHDFRDSEPYDRFIDRRLLEREGWVIQDPDQLRGHPFERAIHPTWVETAFADPRCYPTSGRTEPEGIVQVVYVPIGAEHQTWVKRSWAQIWPNGVLWYNDDTDFRVAVWNGILFIKSDH
jgi:hypothetical protein